MGVETAYLAMKLNAWEVLGGGRGGRGLVDESMESTERHRDGTGVTVSRVCVPGWSPSGVSGGG